MGKKDKQGSKNWKLLKNQEYKDQVKTRDVHTTQTLERGKMGKPEKPIMEKVGALLLGLLFAGIGYLVGHIVLIVYGYFTFIQAGEGSIMDFSVANLGIREDWRLYAMTGASFLIAWLVAHEKMMMAFRARNAMSDGTDINSYENDQHIMLFEEMQESFDWFPDVGAHSSVQVSSMLSHMMIEKKGLKSVDITRRHEKDVKDESGRVIHYKGEPLLTNDGTVLTEKLPIIDSEFGQELFTASGIPAEEKAIRKPFDVKKIMYNPKDETGNRKDRDKQPYDTVADLINNDWDLPEYEVQRPAGAYLVDTAPVNTMV